MNFVKLITIAVLGSATIAATILKGGPGFTVAEQDAVVSATKDAPKGKVRMWSYPFSSYERKKVYHWSIRTAIERAGYEIVQPGWELFPTNFPVPTSGPGVVVMSLTTNAIPAHYDGLCVGLKKAGLSVSTQSLPAGYAYAGDVADEVIVFVSEQ